MELERRIDDRTKGHIYRNLGYFQHTLGEPKKAFKWLKKSLSHFKNSDSKQEAAKTEEYIQKNFGKKRHLYSIFSR